MKEQPISFKEAAAPILDEAGEALHYQEITRRILERGLVTTSSRRPDATHGRAGLRKRPTPL